MEVCRETSALINDPIGYLRKMSVLEFQLYFDWLRVCPTGSGRAKSQLAPSPRGENPPEIEIRVFRLFEMSSILRWNEMGVARPA